jgi:hypothetical protein
LFPYKKIILEKKVFEKFVDTTKIQSKYFYPHQKKRNEKDCHLREENETEDRN